MISVEIYSEPGEKSLVLERNSENLCRENKPSPVYGTPHYVSAVQESVRRAHGVVQACLLLWSFVEFGVVNGKNTLPVPSCGRYTDLL